MPVIPYEALGIKQAATEETLQSIDSTLKRIEFILRQGLTQNLSCFLDVQDPFLQQLTENSTDSRVEQEIISLQKEEQEGGE